MRFLSKDSMKKTAIILVFLTLFNFMIPTYSNAGLQETLVNPIKDLILFCGDGFMCIMQGIILGDWNIKFSTPYGDELSTIKYSPEKIFNNEIPLFSVNFFEPQKANIVNKQNPKVMENRITY